MNIIKIIVAGLFFTSSFYAEGTFWHQERFFETVKNTPTKVLAKPKSCPDGSYFLILEIEHEKEKTLSETATCVYGNSEIVVEHQWINGVKYRETTIVNDQSMGIEKLRLSKNVYAVNENCNGKMVRVEILDKLYKLDTILLYTSKPKPKRSTNDRKPSPDVIIKVKEKTITGKDKLSNFSGCNLSMLPDKLKPPVYWKWFDLEKAKGFTEQ